MGYLRGYLMGFHIHLALIIFIEYQFVSLVHISITYYQVALLPYSVETISAAIMGSSSGIS